MFAPVFGLFTRVFQTPFRLSRKGLLAVYTDCFFGLGTLYACLVMPRGLSQTKALFHEKYLLVTCALGLFVLQSLCCRFILQDLQYLRFYFTQLIQTTDTVKG